MIRILRCNFERTFYMNKIILTLVFGCLTLTSCLKDLKSPKITVDNPLPDSIYKTTDLISINGKVTDNKELKDVDVHVVELSTKDTVLHDHHMTNGTSFTIVASFTPAKPGAYQVYIEAIDLEGNEAESSTDINIKN